MKIKLAFKKLTETAILPQKPKSQTDAGYDLYSDIDKTIQPNETTLINTGIAVQQYSPSSWNSYCLVKDTSGNALKKKLSVKAGVVDKEYRGEIGVVIKNNSTEPISIVKGDKIAQLIPTLIPLVEEVDWVDDVTSRGIDGFGSTGVVGDKK